VIALRRAGAAAPSTYRHSGQCQTASREFSGTAGMHAAQRTYH
jgi:hypothetical protein